MNIEKNSSSIGNQIRQLRKSKGMTQEQFAELLGIDNKHLSRIENGYHKPNYQLIKKLLQRFNFDIRTFEDESLIKLDIPDEYTAKSLKILNSAKNAKEKEYYLSVLQLAHKGLMLGREKALENTRS